MADLPKPRQSFVMLRGQYDRPGRAVARDASNSCRRFRLAEGRDYKLLDFAEWLVSGKHPLTARVVVNRFGNSSVPPRED